MSSEGETFIPPRNCESRFLTAKDFPPRSENYRVFPDAPEEEIVISGVSGRFPSCDNVEELSHNLYNKVCQHNV